MTVSKPRSSGSAARYARAVRAPDDELATLYRSSQAAVLDGLLGVIAFHTHKDRRQLLQHSSAPASRKFARAMGEAMALADLIGRRRLLLELRARGAFRSDPADIVPHVPFEEAVADIVSREPVLAASAAEVSAAYTQRHAFSLARKAEISVVRRVQKALGDMARLGVAEPSAARLLEELAGFSRAYAQTVFRTNLASANAAGRWRQSRTEPVRAVASAFEYIGPDDADTRRGRPKDNGENHRAAIGLIAAFDDPVWDRTSAPSGFGCRHTLRILSNAELKRRGLLSADGTVRRREPSNFSQFRPHPDFTGRPDVRFYG